MSDPNFNNDINNNNNKIEKKTRTRRACDLCNLKRSKCEGGIPCNLCVQLKKPCTSLRAERKRGRASERYPKNPKKRKDSRLKDEPESRNNKPVLSKKVIESVVNNDNDNSPFKTLSQQSLINNDDFSISESIPSIGLLNQEDNDEEEDEEEDENFIRNNSLNSDGFLPTEYALHLENYIFSVDANSFKSSTFLKTQQNYSVIDAINNNHENHPFDGIRYVILLRVIPFLKQARLPGNIASDLLDYYFDTFIPPACRISTILRRKTLTTLVDPILNTEEQLLKVRNTNSALILAMLATASFDINHFFMTGHKRKLIFGQLFESIKRLISIDSKDETLIIDGTFDDVITCAHMVVMSPLFGNPAISYVWLQRGIKLAKFLEINKENYNLNANLTEDVREERRRCWWSLYILDKHLHIALNTPTVMTDKDSMDCFHPCSDNIYNDFSIDKLPCPIVDDLNRPKGIQYGIISSDTFGWLLSQSMLIGLLVYYKTYKKDQHKRKSKIDMSNNSSDSSPNNLHSSSSPLSTTNSISSIGSSPSSSLIIYDYSEIYKSQLRQQLDVFEKKLPILLKYSNVDLSYATVITCVLNSLFERDVFYWQSGGMLPTNNNDEEINYDFQNDLDWCLKYSQSLQNLLSYDPDMRKYPFIIRVYIFFVGADVLNLLHHIDKEFLKYKQDSSNNIESNSLTKLCYNIKSMAHIIIRCLECLMTTLPADYLRTIRNTIMDALRDMDCLLMIKGYENQFAVNREKRKKIISLYSYVVNGSGIGL